jgi:hypothetical protein
MDKLKVRPMFSIGTTHFIVDIDKQVLREFQRPENEISFIRDMEDKQTHYELRYDPRINNAAREPLPDNQVQIIPIPQMTELDPEQMSVKYGCPVEQLKGKPDFEIIVDQEALALRHQGMLPKIDISGDAFVVDLRMQELRHAANFYPVISLKSFELTHDGWNYEAYYHPVMKQVVDLDPKLLEFPEGVIKIRIPNEIGLDPVSAARIYGMNERELLRRYPIQKELKAEIIPLSETNIPALIRRNREALREEHRQNMERAKPRFRPKL